MQTKLTVGAANDAYNQKAHLCWDPQIAAIYYDQIVHHGKHHTQAVCVCATHLLDRIWTILKEDRAYQLRDVDGTPVTVEQARQIITCAGYLAHPPGIDR